MSQIIPGDAAIVTMPHRLLFLDDCPYRTKWAAEHLHAEHGTLVSTAEDAIRSLSEGGQFDRVYLDHDLSGETYVDSSRKDCGFEVVRWIVANRPAIGLVIAHTLNTPAGNLMVRALRYAGYKAVYVPFTRLVGMSESGAIS